VTAADGPDVAAVTKRYTFNALQENREGRDWDCYVTVHGTIDPVTGMVTDIGALDRLVQDRIIKPFDRQDLRQVLGSETVSGEALTKMIWDRLAGCLSGGTLHNVRLVQTRDLSFDYAG
jgi:6-pyruvoyltetrahydropterin/6-carboxytetrahydropterin synthase